MTTEKIQRSKQAKPIIGFEIQWKIEFALTVTTIHFIHTSSQPYLQMATWTVLTITSFCNYVLCLGSLKEMPEFTFEVRKCPGSYRLFSGIWQKSGIFIFFQCCETFSHPTPSYFVVPNVISGISPYTSLATSNLVSFFS